MKRFLLLLVLLFSIGQSNAQCAFTYTQTGSTTVAFTPPYNFPGISYSWTFGDGTGSFQASPIHSYNSLGLFGACLTMYDSMQNVICSTCDTVVVGSSIYCPISIANIGTNAYQMSVSAAFGTTVSWSFGDGTSGSGATTTHTYSTYGTYTVGVTVTDSSGAVTCNSTASVTVSGTINYCNWSYSVANVLNPLSINFQGNFSPMSAATYIWDFGDGTTGTGMYPNHIYSAPGQYWVCMMVSNGVDSCNSCGWAIVNNGSTGNCSFFAVPDSTNSGLYYFFPQNVSSTAILNWNFGDGSSTYSIAGNMVQHTYSANATYLVCFTEIDSMSGTTLCTFCDSVSYQGGVNCTFTEYNSPGTSPLLYVFTTAQIAGTTTTWDFGDGSTAIGSTVTHLYAVGGTYYVCEYAVDAFGSVLCSSCHFVTVSSSNNNCQANFYLANVGLDAYFVDQSVLGNNTSSGTYLWNFGDGSTSTLQFPNHTYAAQGYYTICLTVSGGGCTSTYCDSVYIDSTVITPVGCNAYFIFTQLNAYQMAAVNLSSGVNLSFSWDFGDGSPVSTQPYPTHYYQSTGTYMLCLTVGDNNGCTSTYCDTLVVDSTGNIHYKVMSGFTLQVVPPNILGVNHAAKAETVKIHPNPATDLLYIDNAKSGDVYRIYSVAGAKIAEGVIVDATTSISLNTLQPGMYMLELQGSNGSRYTKFVCQ